MAFYLLNICVDNPDAQPNHIPEDLSFNDQESLIEIFVEKILGYENAIAEYDDHDPEEHNKSKKSRIDNFLPQDTLCKNPDQSKENRKQQFADLPGTLPRGYLEIDSPPPKS